MRRKMSQYTYACFTSRKRCFLTLLLVFTITIFGCTLLVCNSVRWAREEMLQENFADVQTRLSFLESQYDGKQEDIYNIQEKIQRGYVPSLHLSEKGVANTTYSPELEALLRNISGSMSADALLSPGKPDQIKTPFSLRIMPHLLKNPDSLRPAFLLKSTRQFADFIIGIPHVKRDKENYLYDTLRVLLKNLTNEERNITMIVVMVGETDLNYVVETAHHIEVAFPLEIKNGLIEVISPSNHYYPDFEALPPTLGDSLKRVRWRTKQNLDTIYLMAYSQSRCLYYLMIEDDVIAAEGYMAHIRKFTASTTISNPKWFFIQYSTTGGIGKLFRSTDLIHFMTYVQLFYYNMPIDWLTESYLADRTCGINKGAAKPKRKQEKECADAKNKIRPTYSKDLFSHIGLFSSLKGKVHKVKLIRETVVQGGAVADFFPHENPPLANIVCEIAHHESYTIEKAYRGETFFWGRNPRKDDVIEFWFKDPTEIDRYLIRSGSFKHINDKINNAVLSVLPNKSNGTFRTIDAFDEFGMVEGHVNSNIGDIVAIQIRFNAESKYWVMITEIEFVPVKQVIT